MRTFDDLTMPCCPICDNAIEEWEPAAVIRGNGAQGLAHLLCVEADEDDEEDDD